MLKHLFQWLYLCFLQFHYLFHGDSMVNDQVPEPSEPVSVFTLLKLLRGPPKVQIPSPVVEINQGQVIGVEDTNYYGETFYAYKGIPYAVPPLGELRFKAPVPGNKWAGVFNASKEARACYQHDSIFLLQIIGVEDCLYLNVFTKSVARNGTLQPVMFYIHGGGFTSGTSNSVLYGPRHLLTADVVLVTIQYRLGILGNFHQKGISICIVMINVFVVLVNYIVLGFLNLDDTNLDAITNAGMRDIILALQWVRDNVEQFNGDPNSVTIFGESAGAAAVHLLVLSPMASGLFHKAIMQSGSAINSWSVGNMLTLELLSSNGWHFDSLEEALNTFRQMSLDDLIQVQSTFRDTFDPNCIRYVVPVVEKLPIEMSVLPASPIDLIRSGDYAHVPMIFGYNSREGLMADVFMLNPNSCLRKDIECYVPSVLFTLPHGSEQSQEVALEIAQFYLNSTKLDRNLRKTDGYYQMATDAIFVANIQAAIGLHTPTAKQSIYMYEMTVDYSLNLFKIYARLPYFGVAHTDDVGYLFNTFITPPNINRGSRADILIQRFVRMWTNLARYGDPTPDFALEPPFLPTKWLPSESNAINLLQIGDELEMHLHYSSNRTEFWKQLPYREI